MIETLILTYFAINIFMAGYNFSEDEKWETKTKIVFGLFLMLFFGSVFVIFYYLFILFSPIFNWIRYEIVFQYKFHFTKYWQEILLDDDYSEKFLTKEEKLEWLVSHANNYNKQSRRHSKIVYNKYK